MQRGRQKLSRRAMEWREGRRLTFTESEKGWGSGGGIMYFE